MNISKKHPRHSSLSQRHALQEGLAKGIVTPTGMIAFGRGEAFDYLLGEKTLIEAKKAIQACAASLLLAKKPVISVNGNVAALCAKDVIWLSKELNCQIEANIFYPPLSRRTLIAKHFARLGKKILGEKPDKKIRGIKSNRAMVHGEGILSADVVLVAIEDGDRTEHLKKLGKKVIAIDLNPKSRTAVKANITIVDNAVRAIPLLTLKVKQMKKFSKQKLEKIVKSFDNKKNLKNSLNFMKKKI